MRERTTPLQKRCCIATAGILVSGLAASFFIYVSAEDDPINPLAEYEGSKRFAYELERIGGKSAVMANEFTNWFSGLWHGRQLACTVACLTVVVAVCYYVIASGGSSQHHDDTKSL